MIPNPIHSYYGMIGHCRVSKVGKTAALYIAISILLHSLVLSGTVFASTEIGESNPAGRLPASEVVLKIQSDNITEPKAVSNLPARSGRFGEVLISPLDISPSDTVLDISPNTTRYIEGSVNIIVPSVTNLTYF